MTYGEHLQQSSPLVPRCGVITLSDTRTPDTDTSGQTIQRMLIADGAVVGGYSIIPDEPEQLRPVLATWFSDPQIHVVITNGGTGIARRDQTIDVIVSIIKTPLPGFGELFRMLSYEQIGSGAMLSRATAGIVAGKVVFALPGSSKAVELAMRKLILPEIRHILREINKDTGAI